MIEDIHSWLKKSGWVEEYIDGSWTGNFVREFQMSGGVMIVNGIRKDSPPVTIKILVEYKGDGWIENMDGSHHADTTIWNVKVSRDKESKETTIVVDSLEQFRDMINEVL